MLRLRKKKREIPQWEDPAKSEPIDRLWEEYQYRHSHIWQMVTQITAAVVALGIVPYLDVSDETREIAKVPPVIALLLAALAIHRMHWEFELFTPVKEEYLKRTGRKRKGKRLLRFRTETLGYLTVLCLGALLNAYLVLWN